MKKVYYKFYSELVSSLPMKDAVFVATLVTLLPNDVKGKVQSQPTAAEAASYFLDHMIKPAVECGDNEPFDILLSKMEISGDIHLKNLAQQIKEEIPNCTNGKNNNCVTVGDIILCM